MAKRTRRTRKKARGLSTAAVHVDGQVDSRTTPISPPLDMASVHLFDDLNVLEEVITNNGPDWFYRRYGHLNGKMLEDCIAELEGGEAGVACASGMSAALTLFWTLTRGGDHIVATQEIYGGTYSFLENELPRLGVDVTFVEPDPEAIRNALKENTKLIFTETIGNPLVNVADLPEIAKVAKRAKALLVVDNTFATPALCRPHTHGVDVVYHSGTKFLGGHGDSVSGVISGPAKLLKAVRKFAIKIGATVPPLDAWLALRGMKTLALRMSRASESAQSIARFLERNRKVKTVSYPGLPSSASYSTAKKVLNGGFGAMMAFEVDGIRAAQNFVKNCDLIRIAPSLGDVSTTVSHPARTSHIMLSPEDRKRVGVTDGLLRLSIGIEDVGDILEDLDTALKKV